jgi:hypothetical protein
VNFTGSRLMPPTRGTPAEASGRASPAHLEVGKAGEQLAERNRDLRRAKRAPRQKGG